MGTGHIASKEEKQADFDRDFKVTQFRALTPQEVHVKQAFETLGIRPGNKLTKEQLRAISKEARVAMAAVQQANLTLATLQVVPAGPKPEKGGIAPAPDGTLYPTADGLERNPRREAKLKDTINSRQQAPRLNQPGPRTWILKVTEPTNKVALALAANEIAKRKEEVYKLIDDPKLAKKTNLAKGDARSIIRAAGKHPAAKGIDERIIAKAVVYLRHNPSKWAENYTAWKEIEIAEEKANGAKRAEKEAKRLGQPLPANGSGSPNVANMVAGLGGAVEVPAKKAAHAAGAPERRFAGTYRGMASLWTSFRQPHRELAYALAHPRKAATLLGRAALAVPAWIPGVLAALAFIGVGNMAWGIATGDGQDPATVYSTHAVFAVLVAVANGALLVANALSYGISSLVKVVVLAILQLTVATVEAAFKGLFTIVNLIVDRINEYLLPSSLHVGKWTGATSAPIKFRSGPIFAFSYLEVDAASDRVIHLAGCTDEVLQANRGAEECKFIQFNKGLGARKAMDPPGRIDDPIVIVGHVAQSTKQFVVVTGRTLANGAGEAIRLVGA